ncbi:polysaccharide deacetylase family protein [Alteromonadaceae bacterium BrNp21-10]|nr:polysaccharide deacetylase family protein [Alteromonadaceae bacterium BrNp21-10]
MSRVLCSLIFLMQTMAFAQTEGAVGESSTTSKSIALTFDDAPRADTAYFSGNERTQVLINSLQIAGVKQAMFFCTTSHITPANRSRLLAYQQAGHTLANHSHNHISADKSELKVFLADLKQSHALLGEFDNARDFYRFPYLHEGDSHYKFNTILANLKQLGYRNGYVTVDSFDWYLDSQFQKALVADKQVDMHALQQLYVDVLVQSVEHYDNLAMQYIGRSPKHVLLLHENDLAALFVDDLVRALRQKGWQIISAQEAYSDDIANTVPAGLFNKQGRIAALAKAQGAGMDELRSPLENTYRIDDLIEKMQVFK